MKHSIQILFFTFAIVIGCAKKPEPPKRNAVLDVGAIDIGHAEEPTPKPAKKNAVLTKQEPLNTFVSDVGSTPQTSSIEMKLNNFVFRSSQKEVSRDSNSQTAIIGFDGKLLSFSDKHGGYSGGRTIRDLPPTRYTLSKELLIALERYIESNDLLKTEEETITTPRKGRESYRVYKQSLTIEYEGKTRTLSFSYKTPGVRVSAQEKKPLNKKLTDLKTFLESLQYKEGSSHKKYTKKEVEDERFLHRNGYKPNETPKDIKRFEFSRYSGTFEKGSSGKYKYPQFSVEARDPEIIVSHRTPKANTRADCTMGPQFKRKFLKMLKENNLHELKTGLYLSPDSSRYGMKVTKYVFEATFRRGWKVKTYLHFFDTPELRKKDTVSGAWIPKFEAFDKELRVLLESKDCPKKKN